MNSQQKKEDEEPYLAHCPSFRDESRESISFVDRADGEESEGDAEFEFSIGGGCEASVNDPAADDIFANGQILPVYPVFNQRLLKSDPEPDPSVQLQALLLSDIAELRSGSHSSSSSAESEIGAQPAAGTYCEWTPRSAPQSPSRVSKSSSVGSVFMAESVSKRWSMMDLVGGRRRSHSDGKKKFVFLNDGPDAVDLKEKAVTTGLSPITSPIRESKKKVPEEKKKKVVKEMDLVTAHKLFYGKKKEDGEKIGRRSFLPYRSELVPLFSNTRTLHPF